MLKQLVLVLLIALIFAQDICPQKLMMECEKDAELGKELSMQPTRSATRQLRRRELTRLPTSTA
jgi:hypothetical protein